MLNVKQSRFVEEYLIDNNATQAAIRAGYAEKTAYSQGQRLLKQVEVDQVVTLGKEDISKRVGITQEQVIEDIIRIGASAEAAGKHNAALKASELLAKHLGMFVERIEQRKDIRITWGPAPQIEAQVQDIIDVTPEDTKKE